MSQIPSDSARRPGSWTAVVVVVIVAIGVLLRLAAAFHTGALVDELTYQYLGGAVWRLGEPLMRPALGQHGSTLFLFHPPFFFYLLGEWFHLWGNDGLVTGRLLSVLVSALLLPLVYLTGRRVAGPGAALIALLFVSLDPWLILINQGIYIENSLMILVLGGFLAFNEAVSMNTGWSNRSRIGWCVVAGLLTGGAAAYKQIGLYILLAILVNLVLTRRSFRLHLLCLGVAVGVLAVYFVSMHLIFGSLFDQETLDQVRRTLGLRHAAGLNYGPLTALSAILRTYWVFPLTIAALVAGGIATCVSVVHVVRRRYDGNEFMVSFAAAAVLSAAGMALKSPHYFILWLVPLYLLLADRLVHLFTTRDPAQLPFAGTRGRLVVIGSITVLVIDLWSFQARFLSGAPDALESALTYARIHLPANAVVAVDSSAAPELRQPFVQFPALTRRELYHRTRSNRRVPYLFVYWSLTNPIPPALQPIGSYCVAPVYFHGFNDNVEICRLVPARITANAQFAADDNRDKLLAGLAREKGGSP